jgi:septal ring factor EnvC (AmiA/AmiB activator)
MTDDIAPRSTAPIESSFSAQTTLDLLVVSATSPELSSAAPPAASPPFVNVPIVGSPESEQQQAESTIRVLVAHLEQLKQSLGAMNTRLQELQEEKKAIEQQLQATLLTLDANDQPLRDRIRQVDESCQQLVETKVRAKLECLDLNL